MRVLHVIPAVAERYGGPSAVIVPMCNALRALGVETLLLSTDADGQTTLNVPLGTPTLWNGVPALFFRRDASEAFKYSRGLSHWVSAHAADFDLVHIHYVLSHAPLAAAAACRRAGVPYIVRPLGTIAPWSLEQKAWRKRLLIALGAGRMLREAAAVHYTTDDERADAEQAFRLTNGVVIPLGITIDRANGENRAARADRRYVLFLSRLHPKKRVELLIEAFAAARRHLVEPWELIVAGDGDAAYVRVLASRAAAAADAAIHFTGWVDGDRKRTLFAGASLFALPSRHENFGVSVLEAMAAGVPVLLTPQVQLARAVREAGAGWIVDADVASMTCTLADIMSNAGQRKARGAAAQALAERFSWPAVANQLLGLYHRLRSAALPHQPPIAPQDQRRKDEGNHASAGLRAET